MQGEGAVSDRVYLKVSSFKTMIQRKRKGKLSPRYIDPYEILDRVRPITYKLALPMVLSNIHSALHVSQL